MRARSHDEASRSESRRLAFLFQDGMVLAATIRALDETGLLRPSLTPPQTVAELVPGISPTGFAHVRIGLRTLAQAGWLEPEPALTPETTRLVWTRQGVESARHLPVYRRLGEYLATFADSDAGAWSRPWPEHREALFHGLAELGAQRWFRGATDERGREIVTAHFDGALVAPVLLWLDTTGRLGADRPLLPIGPLGEAMARIFRALGWLSGDGAWTEIGLGAIDFTANLGLAGSYLPLFAKLPELYLAAAPAPLPAGADGRERHVQRELNIRASTTAHASYFRDADALIARLFNRDPLSAQPRFVLDVGCGDGGWLARIDRLVRQDTLRGRHLDDHPLALIGVDAAEAAVDRARAMLAAAGVEAIVLQGDVGDPHGLKAAIDELGLAIEDGLHVRAFIDHDRSFRGGVELADCGAGAGAYLDDEGNMLTSAEVTADLASHLGRWAPLVGRHGLVSIEAHGVAPGIAARRQGSLHSLAFEAYHAYSRQYPVERRAFLAAVRAAGLRPAATGQREYPATQPFVAVSLNHLLVDRVDALLPGSGPASKSAGSWRPDERTDRSDGIALHRLLYADGDLGHPRSWCAAPTGRLVTEAMRTLEQRLEAAGPGDVLRVCDYGTGTGLAAIELLKACRERGFEQALAERGVELEVHLLDIPSSWFAQGHALLAGCAWTQFHSLVGENGRFRPLAEVTGGLRMDVVLASMVFHLVPPAALKRVAAGLADILLPNGRLLWNAPDLGPARPGAVLFHDPNRALRAHWKTLLAGTMKPSSRAQGRALREAPRDPQGRVRTDDVRAGRRILARPNRREEVAGSFASHFEGSMSVEMHEMQPREALDALLVPSNQQEFLPEITDPVLRSRVIEELMRDVVMPPLLGGAGGTGASYHLLWSFGSLSPKK